MTGNITKTVETTETTEIKQIITHLLNNIWVNELPLTVAKIGAYNMCETQNDHYFLVYTQERQGYVFDLHQNNWITYESKCGKECKIVGIPNAEHQEMCMQIYEVMRKYLMKSLYCNSYNLLTVTDTWVYFVENDNNNFPYYVEVENGLFANRYRE